MVIYARKVSNFIPKILKTGLWRKVKDKNKYSLLNEEMNVIFQKLGLNMINGGMVSISSVKVTPDLLEARFYLSFFQVDDAKAALKR